MMAGLLISLLVGQNLFAKRYTGMSSDWGLAAIATPDGGCLVGGFSGSTAIAIKIRADGSEEWIKTYGPGGVFYSLAQASDQGYFLAGYTSSFGAGYSDVLVLKVTQAGDVVWAKTVGGPAYDDAFSVASTLDGGCIVAGYLQEAIATNRYDFLVIKMSASGTLEWAKKIGLPDSCDWCCSVVQTPDGGYALAGWTDYYGRRRALMVKLGANGSLQWAKTYWAGGGDGLLSMAITSDGGFILTGWTDSFGPRSCFLLKLTSSGDIEWAKTFPGYGGWSIIQTMDGGYAIGGYTTGTSFDFLLARFSPAGDLLWARTFNGEADYDYCHAITQTTDEGYVSVGYGYFSSGGNDFEVLKISRDGEYPGCVSDYPVSAQPRSYSSSSVALSVSDPSLTITTPTIDVFSPTLIINALCPPLGNAEEPSTSKGITCFFAPGGLIFSAQEDTDIRIYSPDGRLVCFERLHGGQNRIPLEPGAYLWIAGRYKGKAIVR